MLFTRLLVFLLLAWTLFVKQAQAADAVMRLATFRADVTPPLGDGPCVGCMPKITAIEHPLDLKPA